jgi:hypothetical protein
MRASAIPSLLIVAFALVGCTTTQQTHTPSAPHHADVVDAPMMGAETVGAERYQSTVMQSAGVDNGHTAMFGSEYGMETNPDTSPPPPTPPPCHGCP